MGAGATLPAWAVLLAWVLALGVLVASSRGRALARYRNDAEARHVLLAATLALMAIRWFNTAALAGVVLHFLGATVATLMFGARIACWMLALASLAGVLLGADWQGWAADFLLAGALPVAVTVLAGLAAMRWVPANVFTYVMANAFGAAALAMAASSLAKAATVAMLGGPAAAYVAATPLMMFGEAFLTGGTMVLVVVYRPHWCIGFDDRVYLARGRSM